MNILELGNFCLQARQQEYHFYSRTLPRETIKHDPLIIILFNNNMYPSLENKWGILKEKDWKEYNIVCYFGQGI